MRFIAFSPSPNKKKLPTRFLTVLFCCRCLSLLACVAGPLKVVGDLEEEEKGGGLWREDKGRTPDIRSNKNPFCSRLLAVGLFS